MSDTRRVVITGAAGGAGAGAVEFFARDGWKVAALVHNARLTPELLGSGDVTEYVCDVADRAAVNATFDEAVAQLGGIDALIHTAATESYVTAADVTEADLELMWSVNMGGTVWTNQAAFRHMAAAGGGSIVNFHSLSAIRGFAMLGHYASSKGGVGAWTRVAAAEWGRHGVRVNAIAPVMQTTMAKNFQATLSEDALAKFKKNMQQVIHLKNGEYGDPLEDIAPVLKFLASDESRYLTGQTISADGGWVKLGS